MRVKVKRGILTAAHNVQVIHVSAPPPGLLLQCVCAGGGGGVFHSCYIKL